MIQAVSPISQTYSSPSMVSFKSARQSQVTLFGQQQGRRLGHVVDDGPAAPQNFLQRLGEKMIRWYQNNELIDKFYAVINMHCLYADTGSTSCSQYTLEKIRQNGFIKGCFEGAGRMLNCNPFSMKSEKMRSCFRDDSFKKTGDNFSKLDLSSSLLSQKVSAVDNNQRYIPSFMKDIS